MSGRSRRATAATGNRASVLLSARYVALSATPRT